MIRHALLLLLLVLPPLPLLGAESSVESELARAKDLRDRYEMRAAETIYAEILAAHPDEPEALLGRGRCAGSLGENPRAEAFYRRFAEVAPDRPDGWIGLGGLSQFLDRREEAEERYFRALEIEPESPKALSGLAQVRIEEGRFPDADRLLGKAEAAAPDEVAVLAGRSEYLFRTGDMPGAVRYLRRILEIEPENVTALRRLSNGFIEDDRIALPAKVVPAKYAKAVAGAIAAYRRIDFDAADGALAPLDTEDAPDSRPAFYRGLIAIRRGELRVAEEHLRRALAIEPDRILVQNAFTVAMGRKLARQRAEYGGGSDPVDRLGPLIAVRSEGEVPGIRGVVPGYERLLPAERRIIDSAARPFLKRLPRLRAAGVTHEILDLDTGMAEGKARSYLATRRTRDGRWYGGIRGVGGKDAATGLESILEAMDLRYDTFAHEIAHQVHRYGMSKKEQARIAALYQSAKAEDRCLDFYAASNDKEYFAQGYEAFVSVVKSPFHHFLRRHTRAELLARDPDLYRFILEVTGTPDPDPAIRPFAARIEAFYEWCGDKRAIERVAVLLAPYLEPTAPDDR